MSIRLMCKKKLFKCIGITGHPRRKESLRTHISLYEWLCKKKYHVIIEKTVASKFNLKHVVTAELKDVIKFADLIIVIGGDGNMLNISRVASCSKNKIIGINCGNLGFLTDLDLKNTIFQLNKILNGRFSEEKKFLLEVKIIKSNNKSYIYRAINEIIVYKSEISKIIEFKIYIDGCFACLQRSDGLIIATPTGSTAYSLSAGGPILTPDIDAIVLVPMFSHMISSRPLIVHSSRIIQLKFSEKNINCKVSCDTQITFSINENDEMTIRKSDKRVCFIHPENYNFFKMLSLKLGWLKNV